MIVRSTNPKIFTTFLGMSLLGLLAAFPPCRAHAQQGARPQADSQSARPQTRTDVGWLGVGIEEVTAVRAQESHLPAEHGVFIAEVSGGSPAAKAGLQKGDVITEFNGQQVQGVVEFRRLVRETPPGRRAQLTVWRNGSSTTVSATLGSLPAGRERHRRRWGGGFADGMRWPGAVPFAGRWPRSFVMPGGRFGQGMRSNTPLLGVSALDLSGQLGTYFGAPDGQGVLVTEVHPGSAAEKAGIKAGDVITKLDGQRVRNIGELRMLLRDNGNKERVTLDILRRGTEMSIQVSPALPQPPPQRDRSHRRIAL